MTLEKLQMARTTAMKNNDMNTKNILSNMIDAIQKASITSKCRVEITEQFANEVLIKYQKTIQEMIDTCPASRPDLLAKYEAEMSVVRQYAPQLVTDPAEIRGCIINILYILGIDPIKKNKGRVMKAIMPHLKGKADMKIVNQVVEEMLV